MTERKLTISALYRPGWHFFPHREQLPHLQLTGSWMGDAGFYPGARVRVDVVADGRMVVTRIEEGQEEGPQLTGVWDAAVDKDTLRRDGLDVDERSRQLEVVSA